MFSKIKSKKKKLLIKN